MMSDLVKCIGEKLVRKEGEDLINVNTESLVKEGSLVGLYFSASWCSPCQKFTPELVKWFTDLTSTGKKLEGKLEIIFLSSDEDETKFIEYFKIMPWYALPYSDRDKKKEIAENFQVKNIPTLIFLDAKTGDIHTKDGRQIVNKDKDAIEFPWLPAPDSISSFFNDPIVDNQGNTFLPDEVINGKSVSLFFSAHWCPPCKRFTPILLDLYQLVNKNEKKLEIIFFSLDRNLDEYNQYFATLPFKGLPFDVKKTKKMARRFFISGIPALVMMNDKMEVLNLNARTHIELDPTAKLFPWKAGIFGQMKSTHDAAYAIAHPSVIYAPNTNEGEIEEAKCILQEIHNSFKDRNDILLNFFYYVKDPDIAITDPCEEIYQKAIGKNGVCILFDAKNSCKYVFDKIDKNDMRDKIQQFLSDGLKMESLT
ncbi:Nucleoredoxin [Oopsacas minuta]|uniref:Nucleoredoxin n=1 Tax=Oopsacas minuta TaxID=111878 RepID=A0AAV7K282_9METZ|nr:Nucleoredoxin [Oopsacas minuta]